MNERWVIRPGEEIVYGVIEGGPNGDYGVFVPRRVGEQLIGVYEATTWGELRRRAGEDLYAEALECAGLEEGDPLPGDDDPFDAAAFDSFGEGDWPDWAAQKMEAWLPDEVPAAWLGGGATALNGDWVEILVAHLEDVAAVLRGRGHPCVRDDRWVGDVERR